MLHLYINNECNSTVADVDGRQDNTNRGKTLSQIGKTPVTLLVYSTASTSFKTTKGTVTGFVQDIDSGRRNPVSPSSEPLPTPP